MKKVIGDLLSRMDVPELKEAGIIRWGAPVPSFGNIGIAKIATLGLNPSNREFVDTLGNELNGEVRRFHTLKSLRIPSWSKATNSHIEEIEKTCTSYFHSNPYDQWFRQLDYLLNKFDYSYYSDKGSACHLDLVPFATERKWTELMGWQRRMLITQGTEALGILLRDSKIRALILNGSSVVTQFQIAANTTFESRMMPSWILKRSNNTGVSGRAFTGRVSKLNGVDLGREIVVLGYNHNIQSSFGVTKKVCTSIGNWLSKMIERHAG